MTRQALWAIPGEIPHLGMIQMLGSRDSDIHGFIYIGMSDKGIARELGSYHITNSNSLALMKENTFFSDKRFISRHCGY